MRLMAWMMVLRFLAPQAFASNGDTVPQLPRFSFAHFEANARPALQAAYQEALQHPEDAAAAGRLGMLLQAYEDFPSAELCYRRAHGLDPDSFSWPYLLGVVLQASGKNEESIGYLRQALTRNPTYSAAEIRLGDALLQTGDVASSARAYKAVLEREPESPLANYGLGRALLEQKDFEAAAQRLEKACEADPEFGSAHYALALAYRDLGRREAAKSHLDLYRRHQNRWPGAADPLLDQVKGLRTGARQLLADGVRLAQKNLRREAIQQHEKALEADPNLAQAHVNLIRLHGELKQFDEAERHYREAVQLNPNLAESHYNYGVILSSEGHFEDAAEAFEKTLQINPHHARAQNNLGFMRESLGKPDEALRLYRQAVRNDPTYRLARFNLGRMLVAQGDLAGAVAEFGKIITPDDEETPRYMYALAAAHVKAGELEKAHQYAAGALKRARSLGQTELAEKIARDLMSLEKALNHP